MPAAPLIVFDLDGTLVDSREAIVATLNAALVAHGDPPAAPEAVGELVGLPLWDMFPRLVDRPLDADALDARVATYRALYPERAGRIERAFPGVPALLRGLVARRRRLAVATSKSTAGAEDSLARRGFRACFELALGLDSVARPKPAPDLVHAALRGTGLSAAVVVGDTTFDVEMGRAAGARTIAVTWGNHPRERLAGADLVVDTVAQLAAALDRGPRARPATSARAAG